MSRLRHRARGGGFSLIEVLVALSLLAVGLGMVFQVLSGLVRLADETRQYNHALALAESRLSALGIEETPRPGARKESSSGNYRLTTSVRRMDGDPSEWAYTTFEPYLITVDVSWPSDGGSRSVAVTTVRLGRGR